MTAPEFRLNLSRPIAQRVAYTTCYMCACRCGIKVHVDGNVVRYIEGNRDHPVNGGVICGKGAAGIMHHRAPSRLRAPLKRIGPRGSGQYVTISWEEALATATEWLSSVRRTDPKRLAFFTGRDQSQALTGWFAQQFGTLNFAAHGGFCSVNMAAAGLYSIGGSFWEFGEPDWEHTRLFLLFGVAEDHSSNPLKIALGKLKARGTKVVSINPVQTGYSAIADQWVGVRPGTDGLLVAALIHELLKREKVDLSYLVRFTNAPWLVIDAPGTPSHGLFARGVAGEPLTFDRASGKIVDARRPEVYPALTGRYELADGRTATPVFANLAERFLDPRFSPFAVAAKIGISPEVIIQLAHDLARVAFDEQIALDQPWVDWAGRRHDKTIGRPVSMHAMRGISAHTNGFETCRMIHLLQVLLGSIDCPGGFRFKPPFPKPTPPPLRPAGKLGTVSPGKPLSGAPLGFPQGPEDLLVGPAGEPLRLDKAYSWDAPLAAHGLMHMVITNAANFDPYPIDVLFMYMANMSWNSTMNVPAITAHLTARDLNTGEYKIPRIIYSDAFASEMVAYADLVLPDTTYLERWDCISLLDRPISDCDGAGDAIRQPVVEPDRDVRPFQTVLLDLGARLELPGFVTETGAPRYPGGYPDYIVNHERSSGIGPLAGWRGISGRDFGVGAVNPKQLEAYVSNGGFHYQTLKDEQRYYRHANAAYLAFAKSVGWIGSTDPIVFQLYLEPLQRFRLAAEGYGTILPPDTHRSRIRDNFDPVPGGALLDLPRSRAFHAITQRPMHMYHSWGSHNAWLRQITAENRIYMNRGRGRELGIGDDDWIALTSDIGRVVAQVRLMEGVNRDTVWTWNAIGRRGGAAALDDDAPEAMRGFLLNHLIGELLPKREGGYRFSNSDPVTGQAAWYDLQVDITRVGGPHIRSEPVFEPIHFSNGIAMGEATT
ncbi:MAG: molybdopterin-dependent oxidoreductase [Dongiaceae bacterium]